MSRAGRPSARRAAFRGGLSGMDGGPQLRAALDAARRAAPEAVVVIDNGRRGPGIIDSRNLSEGEWLFEGLIPAGTVAAIADLDDPSPATLLENGFDVVIRMHARGAMDHAPIRVSSHWRPNLVPGREPPATFYAQRVGGEFVRVGSVG